MNEISAKSSRKRPHRAPPAKYPEGVSDPRGLDPAAYHSPELYQRELERIFAREWLCIGRVEDVSRPGDFVSVDIVGEPLVMVRDLEGKLRVHSRICRHRSMVICEGAGNARSFMCPYHAWTYGLDGRLAGAPEMEFTPGFDRAACTLVGPKVEVWEGFVFVNFDKDAAPLAPRLTNIQAFYKNWNFADHVSVRSYEFDVPWNWKVMCENYIEAYHHIGAHRLSLEPVMPTRLVRVEDIDGPFTICHMPHIEDEEVSGFYSTGEVEPKLPRIPGLTEAERTRGSLNHIFPFLLISTYPDRMEYYLNFPLGPDRMRTRKIFCVPKDVIGKPEFEPALKVATEQYLKFRLEDVGVNNGIMAGVRSRYAERGRMCHLERPLWQFRQWWEERMGLG